MPPLFEILTRFCLQFRTSTTSLLAVHLIRRENLQSLHTCIISYLFPHSDKMKLSVLFKQVQSTELSFLPPLLKFLPSLSDWDWQREYTECNQVIFPSILKTTLGFLTWKIPNSNSNLHSTVFSYFFQDWQFQDRVMEKFRYLIIIQVII